MPSTETPPNPASTPQGPPEPEPRRRRGARRDLEGLEAYDLLHVIDDLEDERSRALLREKIWIALLFHVLLFLYLLYGPKYIQHVHVVDPSNVLRDREKQMTFLDLPPDALKQVRPKHAPVVSDKDRVEQSQHPTVDKKTLQQMQSARRAAPPAPQPAPPQAPTPQPQQVAQQPAPAPVQRPAQPLPQNQNAQADAPAPKPTRPAFTTGASTPGEALQQAARAAAEPGGGGAVGANAPSQHGGMQGAVDVLSDTLGVDFGPYIQRVIYETKRAWYPIIPPSAQPPISKQGRVAIRFKIYPDGSVKSMTLEGPSGDVSLDRAAWGGITGAAPYPWLPKNFKGPYLELRFFFLYNEQPGN